MMIDHFTNSFFKVFTHFYVRGRAALGEKLSGVIIGWPSTNPVVLITGSGILRDPMPTLYGDFWLRGPWEHRVHFNPMPLNGVRLFERVMVPPLLASTEYPIQVVVGTELTNLWVTIIEK